MIERTFPNFSNEKRSVPLYIATTFGSCGHSTAATDCQRARPCEADLEPARPATGARFARYGNQIQARSRWRKDEHYRTHWRQFKQTRMDEAATALGNAIIRGA
jgi:hypothetical protein